MRPPLKPEQVIGKYRVVRLIAMGGMGAVYEVVHLGLERRDALKAMLPEFAALPELRARFIREAKVTNRVRHPGIVQIYEISELADGSPYFVMEYIDGETLAQRMDGLRQRPGQQRGVTDLAPLRQVASILSSCHAKGLIHRDLKPSNIMLVKDSDVFGGERAKLLDFGIVKVQEDANKAPSPAAELQTQAGLLLGTPEYMAPEQWGSGQPITEKVDVYALGVMAYRILSGNLPFVADTPLALGVLHLSRLPMPLRERSAQLPIELGGLVDRMLAKDPHQRPSISEFVSALDRMGDRTNYSELRSGQLVIPDSFSSGSQLVPTPPDSGNARPVLPAPRVNVQPHPAAPPANVASAPASATFVPSNRPALPESTTARGNEPAYGNASTDFASALPPSKEQPANPAAAGGAYLYVADEIPVVEGSPNRLNMKLPARGARPASHGWRWLGLVGLLSLLALGGIWFIKGPSLPPTDARPDAQPVLDLAPVMVDARTQPDAPLADLSVPDLAEDTVDLQILVDLVAPAPSRVQNPDLGTVKTQIKKQPPRRSVGLHCIVSRDIPAEQQKLIVDSFKKSRILLAPGERVTLGNRDGRPHVEQMPPPLLDQRELLEYALRGIFPQAFPKLVIIQCPAAK